MDNEELLPSLQELADLAQQIVNLAEEAKKHVK
jgi:hypothetical protein